MALHNQKTEHNLTAQGKVTYLEILVVRLAGQWFGVRSDQNLRLLHFVESRLSPASNPALTGLAGFLGELDRGQLPCFDLAALLELPTGLARAPLKQLIRLTLNGRNLGFAIEEAQEIQRVALTDLKQIPPVIKILRSRPAAWAVWLRSPEQLIPLLDFSAVLDNSAWKSIQLGPG
jgi:chemotaxis signal transduction protein